MINKYYLIMVIIFTAMVSSCKKDVDIPAKSCMAGIGGEESMILFPEHHGESIPGLPGYPDSAFIKFNVNEFPGDNPALYDLIVVGEEGSASIKIENLKCGKYYIFVTGKDASLDERVTGGIPYTIENKSGINLVKVAITED